MKIKDFLVVENDDYISLKALLQDSYPQIFTVHRLDRETSGLIVFAKNEETHKHLSKQFEERQTEKIYVGLVIGSPTDEKGTINKPIAEHPIKKGFMIVHQKGKESLTDYEVLEDFGIYSYLKFRIYT